VFSGNYQQLFYKFLRFGVVGAGGTLIDFGITYVSKEIFKAHKYLANALGFSIAATFNYFLNRVWTFHSDNPDIGTEYMEFIAVAVVGLGINTAVLYFLHHNMKMNFYVAKIIATGVTVFWNFVANYLYTFRGR
jgi:putative flippase GtrA